MSEMLIGAEKGGEFIIDADRRSAGSVATSPEGSAVGPVCGFGGGGFVMSCRVQGEGKPLVQLAMRHVMCVDDAAIFMALGAAVDLSVEP
ncbi:hypothetical protein CASFOL_041100 [Castilleja foliolosa]|uniref:Uncharacterized protein n=1 Tax=Castilleja foliolosa TaxID=1961234 RepID=A0ABD3BE45_9LAMI